MTNLPPSGAQPTPHMGQVGHFDIDFLIDQCVMIIDHLIYLTFPMYGQDFNDHVDILFFPVRYILTKLWFIR